MMQAKKWHKKILIAMPGVAVLFYQLHGVNYLKWFNPPWFTRESLKQKSYDLFKSPLFWTIAGSGMIAIAVWNLYKKRSAPGSSAPQLDSSSATAFSAPAAGVLPETSSPPGVGTSSGGGQQFPETQPIKTINSKIAEIIGKPEETFQEWL